MATTVIDIMNGIRTAGSQAYQDRIPVATDTNFTTVGQQILSYNLLTNEFCNILFNKVGMQRIHQKIFENPLAVFKAGKKPITGQDIEDIYSNPAVGADYDETGADLMSIAKPDVKVVYHRMNRRSKYKISILDAELEAAFISPDAFVKFLASNIQTLYNGDNIDEFVLMKQTFANAIVNNKIVNGSVLDPLTDEASAKTFVKQVKTLSGAFRFPSSKFNTYYDNKPAADTGKAFITQCPKEEQVLILRSDVLAQIDVEVLSAAFNLSKTEFLGKVIEVDNFGKISETAPSVNVHGILCDKSALQVYDDLNKLREFDNGSNMARSYWWHHWQTYAFSPCVNAVALCTAITA